MRRSTMAVWALASAMLAGCARTDAAAKPVDGVLVLEVGGDQSSLRQALNAAGIDVPPARARATRPAEAFEPMAPSDAENASSPARPAPGRDRDAPATAADHIVVELGRGETLMQLAKKHLGSSGRYREILERNGWTEADARRLRAGQLVKVPLERAAPGR